MSLVVAANPMLRTQYAYETEKADFYHAVRSEYKIPLEVARRYAKWAVQMGNALFAPFDLFERPPIRALLATDAKHASYLMIALHHVVTDLAGIEVLREQLSATASSLLCGKSTAPIAAPYADYFAFCALSRTRADDKVALEWWVTKLKGAPGQLKMPRDALPDAQAEAGHLDVLLTEGLTEQMQALCTYGGITVESTLLAVWCSVLLKQSSQTELTIGVLYSMRSLAGKAHAQVVGTYIGTLPVRHSALSDSTKAEAQRMDRAVSEAVQRAHVPLHHIISALELECSSVRLPLFHTMSASQEALVAFFDGIAAPSAKTDLELIFYDTPEELSGRLIFDAQLFTTETASKWGERFTDALEDGINLPSST